MLEEYETSCPYALCVAVKSSTLGVPPLRSGLATFPPVHAFNIRYSEKRKHVPTKTLMRTVSGIISSCKETPQSLNAHENL
jgi:hypothetical protein